MTLAIRTDADAARVVSTVRADVHALDPTLPLFGVRTMASLVRAQLEPERLATALLSGFALFALTLAAVGVYGVMAFATGQRTREVAVRLALGARRRDIVAGLVRDGVRVIVAGALAGTLLAFPGTRLVGTLLPGAAPAGWLAVVAAIVLTAVSILACWIPARRAARVDPMQVLRGQ
jgi:ABC-type antimicrobial peptide transport system permease subunit